MKAGLLEVADVLVVNKSDQAGADRLMLDLEEAVHTRDIRRDGWDVPAIVRPMRQRGEGIGEVLGAIERHRAHSREAGLDGLRRARRARQVRRVVEETTRGRSCGARGTSHGGWKPRSWVQRHLTM